MAYKALYDLVAVRIKSSANVVFCAAPFGTYLKTGDRVIISSNQKTDLHFDIDGVCLSDGKLIDAETINIIKAVCPEQFPLRYVKARYCFEDFDIPAEINNGEVCNAQSVL